VIDSIAPGICMKSVQSLTDGCFSYTDCNICYTLETIGRREHSILTTIQLKSKYSQLHSELIGVAVKALSMERSKEMAEKQKLCDITIWWHQQWCNYLYYVQCWHRWCSHLWYKAAAETGNSQSRQSHSQIWISFFGGYPYEQWGLLYSVQGYSLFTQLVSSY